MNEYLIYTSQGVTFGPNQNSIVEICHILGRSLGQTFEDALDNLYKENSWITDAGFEKSECISVPILSDTLKKEISQIVDYLWNDEMKHFEESECPSDHIFWTLLHLKNSLT